MATANGILKLALDELKAERAARRARKKLRTCLTHGGAFLSSGPGHRICDACKRTELYMSGVYHPGGSTGRRIGLGR